jgi:hypothetical protein
MADSDNVLLKRFLLLHEDDIKQSIEDFGLLYGAFKATIGRFPGDPVPVERRGHSSPFAYHHTDSFENKGVEE